MAAIETTQASNSKHASAALSAYPFEVGSTGDPPVPSGDPPDGMGSSIERKGTAFLPPHIAAIPPGGSPGGAGGSPARPTLNRYRAAETTNYLVRMDGEPRSRTFSG